MTDRELIERILEWYEDIGADTKFDPDFVYSMQANVNRFGNLTPGQRRALEKINAAWVKED